MKILLWLYVLCISETCPAQYSENMMQLRCYDNDKSKNEIKCNEAIDGSIAKIECAKYYEFPNRPKVREAITRYCYNGKWNNEFPQCVPGQPIVINYNIIFNIYLGRNSTICNSTRVIESDSIIFPTD